MLGSLLMFIKYIGTACLIGWILAEVIFRFTKDDK
jgi:hypothetical protein